jgi:hypothetical protein
VGIVSFAFAVIPSPLAADPPVKFQSPDAVFSVCRTYSNDPCRILAADASIASLYFLIEIPGGSTQKRVLIQTSSSGKLERVIRDEPSLINFAVDENGNVAVWRRAVNSTVTIADVAGTLLESVTLDPSIRGGTISVRGNRFSIAAGNEVNQWSEGSLLNLLATGSADGPVFNVFPYLERFGAIALRTGALYRIPEGLEDSVRSILPIASAPFDDVRTWMEDVGTGESRLRRAALLDAFCDVKRQSLLVLPSGSRLTDGVAVAEYSLESGAPLAYFRLVTAKLETSTVQPGRDEYAFPRFLVASENNLFVIDAIRGIVVRYER